MKKTKQALKSCFVNYEHYFQEIPDMHSLNLRCNFLYLFKTKYQATKTLKLNRLKSFTELTGIEPGYKRDEHL